MCICVWIFQLSDSEHLIILASFFIIVPSGFFPFDPVYCLIWMCLDVLFCTASIMHLCTISVDRYLSLRYPMKFGRNKTRRRVVLKIMFVWFLSVAMSLPLSLKYSQVRITYIITLHNLSIQKNTHITCTQTFNFKLLMLCTCYWFLHFVILLFLVLKLS